MADDLSSKVILAGSQKVGSNTTSIMHREYQFLSEQLSSVAMRLRCVRSAKNEDKGIPCRSEASKLGRLKAAAAVFAWLDTAGFRQP